MAELIFVPTFALAMFGMLLGQAALKRRSDDGVKREAAARLTPAWWIRRFRYQAADFTVEGRRYWRAAQTLQLAAILWAILGFTVASLHV